MGLGTLVWGALAQGQDAFPRGGLDREVVCPECFTRSALAWGSFVRSALSRDDFSPGCFGWPEVLLGLVFSSDSQ